MRSNLTRALHYFQKDRVLTHRYTTPEGNDLGLLQIRGTLRDSILAKLHQNYASQGDHIINGGAISPSSIRALIGSGAGAVAASSFFSGSLYIASANPATLMAIGNGVGSAVMGSSGIIGQAAFIPAAGAIIPVVAPLIAFQAISTAMILNQFKLVNEKLDSISKSVERIIARDEATFVGETISAARRVEELESDLAVSNRFTPSMIVRLALIEDKVNPILERYRLLYSNQSIHTSATIEDLKHKQNDAYLAIILSTLDLRLDALRLRLAIQENPGVMKLAEGRLIAKIDDYTSLWRQIGKDPKLVEIVASELKEATESMNGWQKTMPSILFGKRAEHQKLVTQTNSLNTHAKKLAHTFREDVAKAHEIGSDLKSQLSQAPSCPMDLIYWKDEFGEHSYYTDDLRLIA